MKWWLLLLLITTASAYTISDYPTFFVENGKFQAIYVVGEESPSLDVVSATVISTALAKYPNVTTDIGTARLDIEIADITKKDAIVIGSPCENKAAAQLEGNPEPCYKDLGGSAGYIKLFEKGGNVQLLITGFTAEDRHAAAKFLAERATNIHLSSYIIPTNTGSTPPFFEQKNKTAQNTTTAQNATIETKETPVENTQLEAKAELTVTKQVGEYEPLRELPKKKGFFERFWNWLTSFFT
ncbi:MAG TPA: hypothetical protein VI612_02065 [Candidatus Nanoarchaeia archaeon]|nr:hypothetical protein [Candidatus Nanoarchaeia archaeon]